MSQVDPEVYLIRTDHTKDGIFGELAYDFNDNTGGYKSFATLEHAYQDKPDGPYYPKLPDGTYKLVKGVHQLEHGGPFTAFEVTGVAGHSGILIHPGNFNKDSNGCVLTGTHGGPEDKQIFDSKAAFDEFMTRFKDVNEMWIDVSTDYPEKAA